MKIVLLSIYTIHGNIACYTRFYEVVWYNAFKPIKFQRKSVGWSIYTRIIEILVKTGFMRFYDMSNNRCKQLGWQA